MLKIKLLLIALLALSCTIAEAQYYNGTNGLSSNALKSKLHDITNDHKIFSYSEVKTLLKDIDEDPDNSDNVLLMYSGKSISKDDFASGNEPDFWNREHVWAKSHGFPDEADTAYTDVHHLRPCDASINSSRSNKDFNNVAHTVDNEEGEAPDTYTTEGFWEPRDAVKGDVARMMFYMDTRYNSNYFNLKLVDRSSYSGSPELGVLYTLIKWHELDPVDQNEIDRNESIFGYQKNRNPYIDHPEWVAEIYGDTSNPLMILNTLSFSSDFGTVAASESLTQSYSLNTYSLTGDVTVAVDAPFSVSLDNTTWSNSLIISLASISSAEQINKMYVKYAPTSSGSISNAVITHTTQDATSISLGVNGEEGAVEVLSIADARTKGNGEAVLVTGVVIDAGNNSGNSRVIYDGTAGIVVRSFDDGNESGSLVQGDSITVSGKLGEYNNLLQIVESPIVITVHKQNAALPEPKEILIEDIGEDYESQLIKIVGVTFSSRSTFQGGGGAGNFTVTDGTHEVICRIGSSSHPLVGQSVPSGAVDIVGFVGQFGSDYQISPRTADDITEGIATSFSSSFERSLLIYPNPVESIINIDITNAPLTEYSISVIDATGQIVYHKNNNKSNAVNIAFLNKGIYYLKIRTKEAIAIKKIIKL